MGNLARNLAFGVVALGGVGLTLREYEVRARDHNAIVTCYALAEGRDLTRTQFKTSISKALGGDHTAGTFLSETSLMAELALCDSRHDIYVESECAAESIRQTLAFGRGDIPRALAEEAEQIMATCELPRAIDSDFDIPREDEHDWENEDDWLDKASLP